MRIRRQEYIYIYTNVRSMLCNEAARQHQVRCTKRESRMLFLTASDVFSRVTSAAERAGKKKNLIYAPDRKVLHVYIVGL